MLDYFNYTEFSNSLLGDSINTLKYVSLVTLTLQNAILGLSMRYGRTRDGNMFLSSTGDYHFKITNCDSRQVEF